VQARFASAVRREHAAAADREIAPVHPGMVARARAPTLTA
jgi:hypothetical protein